MNSEYRISSAPYFNSIVPLSFLFFFFGGIIISCSVLGAEMENIVWIILLFSKASSVAAQFNGYNCDANFHSRFPGENMTENHPV